MKWKTLRRAALLVAVILGALLMWLSPETPIGAIVMGAGIALEALCIGLERRA